MLSDTSRLVVLGDTVLQTNVFWMSMVGWVRSDVTRWACIVHVSCVDSPFDWERMSPHPNPARLFCDWP